MPRSLALFLALLVGLTPPTSASGMRDASGAEASCLCCCGVESTQSSAHAYPDEAECCCSSLPSAPHREVPAPVNHSAQSLELAAASRAQVAVLPELDPTRAAPRPVTPGSAPPVRERLGVWLL